MIDAIVKTTDASCRVFPQAGRLCQFIILMVAGVNCWALGSFFPRAEILSYIVITSLSVAWALWRMVPLGAIGLLILFGIGFVFSLNHTNENQAAFGNTGPLLAILASWFVGAASRMFWMRVIKKQVPEELPSLKEEFQRSRAKFLRVALLIGAALLWSLLAAPLIFVTGFFGLFILGGVLIANVIAGLCEWRTALLLSGCGVGTLMVMRLASGNFTGSEYSWMTITILPALLGWSIAGIVGLIFASTVKVLRTIE